MAYRQLEFMDESANMTSLTAYTDAGEIEWKIESSNFVEGLSEGEWDISLEKIDLVTKKRDLALLNMDTKVRH